MEVGMVEPKAEAKSCPPRIESSAREKSWKSIRSSPDAGPGARSKRGDEINVNHNHNHEPAKRRCVSTACIACRRRKSKCDGSTPACAACSSVYGTECVYDPNSDQRRKGVYKKDTDNLKTRHSTLHTLVQAIVNYPEDEIPDLIKQIRSCENLDDVAQSVWNREGRTEGKGEEEPISPLTNDLSRGPSTFETELSGKMGRLRLEDGSVRFIGGTSNLIYLSSGPEHADAEVTTSNIDHFQQHENPRTSWTSVTSDADLIMHLLNMYFTWHYTFYTTLSKHLFYRDFLLGRPPPNSRRSTEYCTPLLVNAMLALGCHFTASPGARENPDDSATAGDHFLREAKRLLMAEDEHEKSKLTTVQALALMSVREAGCGREVKGWVYSGMSFRMVCDLGLNVHSEGMSASKDSTLDEAEEDARRITFWGCYLVDKCWSNYLGRLPQLQLAQITVPKFEVFPIEDADVWQPYTDSGFTQAHAQASRTRAVALGISALCEISDDLMAMFYNPSHLDKVIGKRAELKKLSDIHTRLETWKSDLPKEMEPKEGGLASVLIMHMWYQLLHIHLFRPFLRYSASTSPLPANVSPRKLCTQAAAMISKLFRLYKRSYGLRQICNIAVYIVHSACTIHLLNLPDKNAKRDIIHGLKHLEEIAEGWLNARRTLCMLSMLAKRWEVELPEEAAAVLARTDVKFRPWALDPKSPRPSVVASPPKPVTPMAETRSQSLPTHGTSSATGNQNMEFTLDRGSGAANMPVAHSFQLPPRLPKGLRYERSNNSQQSRHPYHHSPDLAQQWRKYSWSSSTQGLHRRPSSISTTSLDSIAQPQPSARNSIATEAIACTRVNTFGGVDALVGDSSSAAPQSNPQEWWFRDQAQLATGFENWGMGTAEGAPDDAGAWLHDDLVTDGVLSDDLMTNGVSAGVDGDAMGVVDGRVDGMADGMADGMVAGELTESKTAFGAAVDAASRAAHAVIEGGGVSGVLGFDICMSGNPTAPFPVLSGYKEDEWYQ